MGHRRIALVFCVLALAVCPSPAEALDRVAGDGFGYVVPSGFQPAPRKMREAAEKRCVEVASMIPVALKGRPTFRMYIVPELPDFPEASITSYTFTLPEGQTHPSLTSLNPEGFEAGLLQGMASVPELRAGSTVPRNLGDVVAIVTTLAYEHPTGGNRTLRVALTSRKHVACLLLMDSPSAREGMYRMHWDGVMGSLRLGISSDESGFLMRYLPIFGVGLGMLIVLGFVYVGNRRRHTRRQHRTLEESGFRGNTISDLKGSRAVDGLEIFDQEEPPPRAAPPSAMPEPVAVPPLAAPPLASAAAPRAAPVPAPDEDALDFDIPVRKFDPNEVISGAGVAPHASAPEDRPSAEKIERKVLSPSPRKGKGPPKIVRNDDYLRES